jgi:hypothetical protein
VRRLLVVSLAFAAALLCFGGVALADPTQASTATVGAGAHTSFDRTYNWVVSKTDDKNGSVTVAQNQASTIGYTITVSNGSPAFTDSNWAVQDGIVIKSTAPFTLDSLGSVSATALQGAQSTPGSVLVCSYDPLFNPPLAFPIMYTPGPTLGCHYTIALPNGNPGTVTAGVTFGDGSTASGQTAFDFTSHLEPNQPTIFNAGPLQVVDSQGGTLGQVSAPIDALHPTTFTYSVPVSTSTCGSTDIPNTVSLIDAAGHTLATASDSVHVTVTCPSVGGCTLTLGYWKTHSIYGPAAKADPTWNLVGGPNAGFFSSGQSWLQVFNTSPAGGNPYYILAHQYEAAILNQLAGASSTAAVNAALAAAKAFFQTYTPSSAGALAKNSPVRAAAIANADTLDSYNSGLTGPGHCDS